MVSDDAELAALQEKMTLLDGPHGGEAFQFDDSIPAFRVGQEMTAALQ